MSSTACLVSSRTASRRRSTVMGRMTSRYLPRTYRSPQYVVADVPDVPRDPADVPVRRSHVPRVPIPAFRLHHLAPLDPLYVSAPATPFAEVHVVGQAHACAPQWRLRRIPTVLEETQQPGDVATRPGYRLHPLKGDMAGLWCISRIGQPARGVPVRRQRGDRSGGFAGRMSLRSARFDGERKRVSNRSRETNRETATCSGGHFSSEQHSLLNR